MSDPVIPNWWDGKSDPREAAKEQWTRLPEARERYAISTEGRIGRVHEDGSIDLIRPTLMSTGYLSVGITVETGGRAKTYLLHRLVIHAFEGKPPTPQHTDVRHLDGGKKNNRIANLRYGTRSENMRDVITHRHQGHLPVAQRPAEVDEAAQPWYQGYTHDPYLVRVGLEFHDAKKLTMADLAKLWNCGRDVVSGIVHGKRSDVNRSPEQAAKKQIRRTEAEKQKILSMVRAGFTLRQINAEPNIGKPLSDQDLQYYRGKVRREG